MSSMIKEAFHSVDGAFPRRLRSRRVEKICLAIAIWTNPWISDYLTESPIFQLGIFLG